MNWIYTYRLWIAASLVVGIGLGFWFGYEWRKRTFLHPLEVIREGAGKERERTRPRAARTPTPESSPAENAEGSNPFLELTLFEICRSDWARVLDEPLSELERELRSRDPILTRACRDQMVAELDIPAVQQYLTDCENVIEEITVEEIDTICLPLLSSFHSFIARQSIRNEQDLEMLSVRELTTHLLGGHLDLTNLSSDQVQKNIEIANTLILKDPDSYIGYKSKLLNLLIQEIKFQEPVDVSQYESLYSELLTFADDDAPDILIGEPGLRDSEAILVEEPPELIGIDDDLVHIPFLRMSALGDTIGLFEISEDYIDAYPNSYIGYLYLAEAYWKQGDEAAAFEALRTGLGQAGGERMLKSLFTRFQMDPLERLHQLSVE